MAFLSGKMGDGHGYGRWHLSCSCSSIYWVSWQVQQFAHGHKWHDGIEMLRVWHDLKFGASPKEMLVVAVHADTLAIACAL